MFTLFTSQILMFTAAAAHSGKCGTPVDHEALTLQHRYCIIGAGAAGTQLGEFLFERDLDYVIVEREEHAGAFFAKMPLHRSLISINKRNTRAGQGSNESDFAFRHDWNSLIDGGSHIPMFQTRTEEYWPDAGELSSYIQDFSQRQVAGGKIMFQHEVTAINRAKKKFDPAVYTIQMNSLGTTVTKELHCEVIVTATGLQLPHRPTATYQELHEHAVGYEELAPWNGSEFSNKRVLILGNGNAAFETSDAVRNHAAEISIFGRHSIIHKAEQTHYVGHVRAHRMHSQDSVNLKSLDEVWSWAFPERVIVLECGENGEQDFVYKNQRRYIHTVDDAGEMTLIADHDGGFRSKRPVCLFELDFPDTLPAGVSKWSKANGRAVSTKFDWQDPDAWVILGLHDDRNPSVQRILSEFPEAVSIRPMPKAAQRQYENLAQAYEVVGNTDEMVAPDNLRAININVVSGKRDKIVHLSKTSSLFRALLPDLLQTTKGLTAISARFRKPFDVIIRCYGWNMDRSIFGAGIDIDMNSHASQKYPATDGHWQAPSAPGIYFLGALAHGYDKFRFGSAGGFVHGFRYTARALFNILQHKFEETEFWHDQSTKYEWQAANNPQVATTMDLVDRDWPEHWKRLMLRINEASGPYQMSCLAFVDVITFSLKDKQITYHQDVPNDVAVHDLKNKHRVIWGYKYGKQNKFDSSAVGTQAHGPTAKFLHPVMVYLPPNADSVAGKKEKPDSEPKKGRTKRNTNGDVRRLHLYHDRWTDWTGPQELEAVHDFMSYVEAQLFNKRKVERQFHTNIDHWQEQCYVGANYLSMQRLDESQYSPPRDEYGQVGYDNYLKNFAAR